MDYSRGRPMAAVYDQHIRFVKHRNENWQGGGDFNQFVMEYADALDAEAEKRGLEL